MACGTANKPSRKSVPKSNISSSFPTSKATSSSSAPATKAPPPSEASNLLLSQFVTPAGSWECPDCMIQNKPTNSKCVACGATQPNVGASGNQATGGVEFGKSASRGGGLQLGSSGGLKLSAVTSLAGPLKPLAQFAPAAGSWSCDTCLVDNKSSDFKCVACGTNKPGSSSQQQAPPSLGGGFKGGGGLKLGEGGLKFGQGGGLKLGEGGLKLGEGGLKLSGSEEGGLKFGSEGGLKLSGAGGLKLGGEGLKLGSGGGLKLGGEGLKLGGEGGLKLGTSGLNFGAGGDPEIGGSEGGMKLGGGGLKFGGENKQSETGTGMKSSEQAPQFGSSSVTSSGSLLLTGAVKQQSIAFGATAEQTTSSSLGATTETKQALLALGGISKPPTVMFGGTTETKLVVIGSTESTTKPMFGGMAESNKPTMVLGGRTDESGKTQNIVFGSDNNSGSLTSGAQSSSFSLPPSSFSSGMYVLLYVLSCTVEPLMREPQIYRTSLQRTQ